MAPSECQCSYCCTAAKEGRSQDSTVVRTHCISYKQMEKWEEVQEKPIHPKHDQSNKYRSRRKRR
jgi:hypothetical protein